MNIIIRMPNWLGDAVMATPIIEDIKKYFPNSQLTVMAQDKVAPLLQKDPHIDELFSFSCPKGGSLFLRRRSERDILDRIDRGCYDMGILLTNSFSSAWWFYRAHVKRRIGFAHDFRSWLLSDAVAFPKERHLQHLVDTYKDLLAPLGILRSFTMPTLYLSQEERKSAEQSLVRYGFQKGMTLVGINPGASFGPAKCWPKERYREVSKRLLADPHVFVLFFGDATSFETIKGIAEGLPARACNLAGLTSLRELMALISCCDAFLTNDSGPMHIAAAFNISLVALFGSTSDIVTAPYKRGKVIHKHVPCSPCFKRVCPIDFRCMKQIEVEEVYRELLICIQESKNK